MLWSLEHYVWRQVVKNLVVPEDLELRQVNKVSNLVLVPQLNSSLPDKVDLLEPGSITDNCWISLIDTAVHIYYQLIGETPLTVVKEMLELSLEFFEEWISKLSLHLWRDFVVKGEFLDNHVKVIEHGILYVLFDTTVQFWWDIVGLVWFLNLLDPNV